MPCDWSLATAIPRGQCRAVEEARRISFDRCVYPAGTGLLECVHVDVEQWRSLGSCNYSVQGFWFVKKSETHPLFRGVKQLMAPYDDVFRIHLQLIMFASRRN